MDATLDDSVNAAYVIKSLHLSNLRIGSAVDEPSEDYIGIRPEIPIAAAIIDKGIASITSEERRAIDDRWTVVVTQPSSWLLAFKVTAVFAGVVMAVFLLLYAHNRRLRAELNERLRVQREL